MVTKGKESWNNGSQNKESWTNGNQKQRKLDQWYRNQGHVKFDQW